MLEQQMQELRELPARVAGVEVQILQLREEMREAFSATRFELNGKVDGLRAEMHGVRDELRAELHAAREDLRAEIRAGDQATRDFMRMLYEESKMTFRTMGEGKKGRKR
jgi:hypothetical protein